MTRARTGDKWGQWVYDAKLQTLTMRIGGLVYDIPVDEIIGKPGRLADWMAQLAEKSWMDATSMGHFVYAIDQIVDLRSLKYADRS